MSDKPLGMIMAWAIATPVVIICCGGGAALIGSAVAGAFGYLTGLGLLKSALGAILVGIAFLAIRQWRRDRKLRTLAVEEAE